MSQTFQGLPRKLWSVFGICSKCIHVMRFLAHKNIANTLIYTQLVEFEDIDTYHSAIARNIDDVQKFIEASFEYVCKHDGLMIFRKCKYLTRSKHKYPRVDQYECAHSKEEQSNEETLFVCVLLSLQSFRHTLLCYWIPSKTRVFSYGSFAY